MSGIQNFLNWCSKNGLADVQLQISLVETSALFALLTICLLFRMSRTGLIIAYLFVYYWGWNYCRQILAETPETMNFFMSAYLGFGVIVLTFTVVSMLYKNNTEP